MSKIAIIGAGSTVFMRNIVGDVLLIPQAAVSEIALMDIDEERLRLSRIVADKLVSATGSTTRLTATTDRARAIEGAAYVVVMIQVGGYEPATVIDFEVPKRFGLRQTIGDTLGIGGIMRGLRTVPVLAEIAREMTLLCPQALMLQYVNPMAINCWALSRLVPQVRCIGLCHSVQHTCEQLAHDLGEAVDDIVYECAGINHMAFFTRLERKTPNGGREDLYPRLRAIGDPPRDNLVRYAILERFGYFVTESSEHFAEYVPWYIKSNRPDLIERWNIPLDEYPRRCVAQLEDWRAQERELMEAETLEVSRSAEYASQIIEAEITGRASVVYGNLPNSGLIPNLPEGCCVEVPCLVDAAGVHPTAVAPLPPQLAALMQTQINVQALTVEALVTGRREHVYHAAMLDPHTGAELDPEQISALVDALIEAHGAWLPDQIRR